VQYSASSPIGIFDSGVGGLTVARAVMEALPGEGVVYFGDTARVPYGVKSPETVARYAGEITRFLLARQVKLLIVACNTMAAVALPVITGLSPVPVIEVIEAGAKSALAASRTKRIGIIATPSTIASQAYVRALRRLGGPEVVTVARACPLFVPLVEEGWLTHPATRLVAREYLEPLLAEDLDTLILGCTHYPLLRPLLAEVAGPRVRLQDSATAVAARAAAILAELGLANTSGESPRHVFHVTDMPQRFEELGRRFLGRILDDVRLEKIESFGCPSGD
jgi:glutamate racemase